MTRDLRKVPIWPYAPREFPPEGLIPARISYLRSISLLDAARLGYKIIAPK